MKQYKKNIQRNLRKESKEKISKKIRNKTLAAAVMMLIASSAVMSGCGASSSSETAATSQADETDKTSLNTATGSAERMIEDGGMLYFKYRTRICSLSQDGGEIKVLVDFDDESDNNTFWIYKSGLYFDRKQTDTDSAQGTELYGLYRLDLESQEEQHLADLTSQPLVLYASGDRLYVKGYETNVVYSLDENGKTAGELSPSDTVYGRIPTGCSELFNGILPYYTEQYGYMPVQNESCLVIADADGGNPREIIDITNTSSVLFAKDAFFALLRDGNGNTQCYRYEVAEPKKSTLLYETSENISLVEYRDGYLYFMENQASETNTGKISFKRILADASADASANEKIAQGDVFTVSEEPGMTGDFSQNGNFYVTGDKIYCQQFKDYGIYLGEKTLQSLDDADAETTLLEPVLFQSQISKLGHIEAQSETLKSADGSRELGTVYAECLVFDGEGDAVQSMNQNMKELQTSIISAAKADSANMDAGEDDESLVYSVTLTIDDDTAITYLDNHYVCVRVDGYTYTGGAHGTPFRQYFVFDRETGERLSLSDVVANPIEDLQAKVGAAFKELAQETNFAFESPEDLEHTVSDGISYEFPFYISDKGVVFYYAPYEIASYAEGFPEVTVPYSELDMRIDVEN